MDDILKKIPDEHGGTDVVVPYSQVAQVFPSDTSHPDSFDYKIIDEDKLLSWAHENSSWKVKKVCAQAALKNSPPIRFTRIK